MRVLYIRGLTDLYLGHLDVLTGFDENCRGFRGDGFSRNGGAWRLRRSVIWPKSNGNVNARRPVQIHAG